MSNSLPRRVATGAVVIAFVTIWGGIGHGQLNPSPIAKAMIQDTGLPAIDRGLRDQDPPRAARTARDADRMRAGSGDTLPYVRGSIIVKFKDDATRGGIAAATAHVAGIIADRSSWADFDIVSIPADVRRKWRQPIDDLRAFKEQMPKRFVARIQTECFFQLLRRAFFCSAVSCLPRHHSLPQPSPST